MAGLTAGPAGRSFLVAKDNLADGQFADEQAADAAALADGQVLLKVDRFAFTANNITYAAFGEAMSYWRFFPAPEGKGNVPVWGFADVVASRAEGLQPGERVYGYFPMSTHLVVEPVKMSARGFTDGAAHRRGLPPVYNSYVRVAADPDYAPAHEAAQMLLRPLFMTSFLIDDFLADEDFFGAKAIVLSSASSKTGMGLAFMLAHRSPRPAKIVGLTSPGNAPFVRSLGWYDETVLYDDIGTLDKVPTVFVDFAGSAAVLTQVHTHLGDQLKHSCIVGASHWQERGTVHDLPGAKPVFFFAPSRIEKRHADWGPGGLDKKVAAAWSAFISQSQTWMKVCEHRGEADIAATYANVLGGRVGANEGHIIVL